MDIKRLKVNPRLALIIPKYSSKFFVLFVEELREKLNLVGEIVAEFLFSPQVIFRAIHKKLPNAIKYKIKHWELLQSKAYEYGWVARGARCYVKAGLTKLQFTRELESRGVRYVLLRWWENFPEFPDGEDMDILMYPEDFKKIKDLITYKKNRNKCDIYLHNGERPGHWNHLPYFPDKLFRQTITRAKLMHGNVRVPSHFFHFATMCYHALYHKGSKSGIKGLKPPQESPEHNYDKLLNDLADKVEEAPKKIDAKSIHEFLTSHGLAPAIDTLSKVADINRELGFLLPEVESTKNGKYEAEFAVYLMRDRALKDDLLQVFLHVFESKKFDIIDVSELNPEQIELAENQLRGGKWDSADYELAAGGPRVVITVLDYHPAKPGEQLRKKYRWLTNANVLKAKRLCRKMLWRKKWFKYYNPIHCADYEVEALEYLEKLFERKKVSQILEEIEKRKLVYSTRFTVFKTLSKGRRSKVELIDYNGERAVKKTFRVGSEAYYDREVKTLTMFQQESFCPKLLDVNKNYYIVKYYPSIINYNSARDMKERLLEYRDDIIDIMRTMYKSNLAYINFTPENILLTEDGELKAIDFEFVQDYNNERPATFLEAYEIKGVPKNFKGDLPNGYDYRNSSFSIVWEYYLGAL